MLIQKKQNNMYIWQINVTFVPKKKHKTFNYVIKQTSRLSKDQMRFFFFFVQQEKVDVLFSRMAKSMSHHPRRSLMLMSFKMKNVYISLNSKCSRVRYRSQAGVGPDC